MFMLTIMPYRARNDRRFAHVMLINSGYTSVERIEGLYAVCPTTCPISVAPRSWAIRLVTARTFSRISSAVAVHWNGFESVFQSAAKRLIAWLRTLADAKVPRRISWRVIMPFQISIWFIHDAPVGVK